jgi:hypothetical protein
LHCGENKKEILKLQNEVLSFSNTSVYLTVEGINVEKCAANDDATMREKYFLNKVFDFEVIT